MFKFKIYRSYSYWCSVTAIGIKVVKDVLNADEEEKISLI